MTLDLAEGRALPVNQAWQGNGAMNTSSAVLYNPPFVGVDSTPNGVEGDDTAGIAEAITGNENNAPYTPSMKFEVVVDFELGVSGVDVRNFVVSSAVGVTFTITPVNASGTRADPARYWLLTVTVEPHQESGRVQIHLTNDANNIYPPYVARARPVMDVNYVGSKDGFPWLGMLAVCSAAVALCVLVGGCIACKKHDQVAGTPSSAAASAAAPPVKSNAVAPASGYSKQPPPVPTPAPAPAPAAPAPAADPFAGGYQNRNSRLPPLPK